MLIDNPTEIGPDWTLDEFTTGGKKYRVVVHSRGNEGGLRPDLVRDLRRIVDAQVEMWGPPDFDRYTFIYHFAADNKSFDGMEHLVSTQIINGGNLGDPGVLGRALEDCRARVLSRLECEASSARSVWALGLDASGEYEELCGSRRASRSTTAIS